MSQKQKEIPLFLLNVTLFPGMTLPLHIFEQRYRTMMKDIMEGNKEFGVVLIKSGNEVGEPAIPYPVGTIALVETTETLCDGRMNISTIGKERFRINSIIKTIPYLVADVEILSEDQTDDLELYQELVEEVRLLATNYVKGLVGLKGGWVQTVTLPSEVGTLVYFIANVLRVGSNVRQQLLEMSTTLKRLEAEAVILREQVGEIKGNIEKRFKFPKSGLN